MAAELFKSFAVGGKVAAPTCLRHTLCLHGNNSRLFQTPRTDVKLKWLESDSEEKPHFKTEIVEFIFKIIYT